MEGKACGVTSEGETAKCKKVVCDPSYLPNKVPSCFISSMLVQSLFVIILKAYFLSIYVNRLERSARWQEQ